jgi:RNA polymerase sigma-70 factor, ECF subfamily
LNISGGSRHPVRVLPEDPLWRLAVAAAEGDNVAVAALVRQTEQAVWQVCAVLGSDGEVEDLVQETYLRALRALPQFRGDAPVRLWLLSIARRTCADHVRRRQRQRRLIDRLTSEVACTGDRVDNGDMSATIDLLQRLDPDRREAFVLTQLAGLSYDDAAAIVGCPIGTIRSRVARARDDLRTSIESRAVAS